MSKIDLYDFIMSVYDLPIVSSNDVSFKGKNKMNKSYPEINKPFNSKKRKFGSQTKNKLVQNQPKTNHLNNFSKEYRYRDKIKNNHLYLSKTDIGEECNKNIINSKN